MAPHNGKNGPKCVAGPYIDGIQSSTSHLCSIGEPATAAC
jgi:hypothetical protein